MVELAKATEPWLGRLHLRATATAYFEGALFPRPPPDGLPVVLGPLGTLPPLEPPPPLPPEPLPFDMRLLPEFRSIVTLSGTVILIPSVMIDNAVGTSVPFTSRRTCARDSSTALRHLRLPSEVELGGFCVNEGGRILNRRLLYVVAPGPRQALESQSSP